MRKANAAIYIIALIMVVISFIFQVKELFDGPPDNVNCKALGGSWEYDSDDGWECETIFGRELWSQRGD